jgi:hypothetical protein
MEPQQHSLTIAARIISAILGVSILAWAAAGEYLVRSGHFAGGSPPILPDTIPYVLGSLAILVGALALMIKRAIVRARDGLMLAFIRGIMRNIRSRGGGTGFGFILVPPALGESIAVMGFVVFYLSGGNRQLFYPFLVWGLATLLLVFPNREYEESLAALDREVGKQ